MSSAPLPWLIYVRVSSDEQVKGVSLDAQLTSCRAYCTARKWEVADEVVDAGVSATTLKREGMARVLAAMQSRTVAGVVVWRLDRLTRSMRDLLHLMDLSDESDVGLVSISESLDTTTPMGKFVVHLLGAIAQWESETIGSRTKTAMEHARRQGYWMGRAIPAGCEVVPAEDGRRKKLVRSAEAETVTGAWSAILAGKSLREVAEDFKAKGVRPTALAGMDPKQWTPAAVRHLLLSLQVSGLLVDPSTQLAVRKVLSEREAPGRRGKALKPGGRAAMPSPLAGLVRCPTCDAAMVQTTVTGGGGDLYRWFRCTAHVRGTCEQKDERCEPIEAEAAVAVLTALEEGSPYLAALRTDEAANRGNLEALRAERSQLTGARDQLDARIAQLTLGSQIGTSAWNSAMKSLGSELDRIDQRAAVVAGLEAAASVDAAGLENAIACQRAGLASLRAGTATTLETATVLRSLIQRIKVTVDEVLVELYRPGSATAPACSYNAMGKRPRQHGLRTVPLRLPRSWPLGRGRRLPASSEVRLRPPLARSQGGPPLQP